VTALLVFASFTAHFNGGGEEKKKKKKKKKGKKVWNDP